MRKEFIDIMKAVEAVEDCQAKLVDKIEELNQEKLSVSKLTPEKKDALFNAFNAYYVYHKDVENLWQMLESMSDYPYKNRQSVRLEYFRTAY